MNYYEALVFSAGFFQGVVSTLLTLILIDLVEKRKSKKNE